MRNQYTLEHYEDKLNHQVIHMDQAVCYCPEFRASLKMHDYPSRKLQLARAVYKNEMEANDYIAALQFQSILSRQGERWQNFGEDPEDCTDSFFLCRELFVKKGLADKVTDGWKAQLTQNNGHIYPVSGKNYKDMLPLDEDSKTALLLDDATAAFADADIQKLGEYYKAQGISFLPVSSAPVFVGFEFFAYGMIDEGILHLKEKIEAYGALGVEKLIVVSAQAYYMFTKLADKLGLKPPFEVEYLLEALKPEDMEQVQKAYIYGGSFNLRYCMEADRLNALFPNKKESKIPTSQEFIPLLDGDARRNRLTIWQKPAAAEYFLTGMNLEMVEKIKKDAVKDIKKAAPEQIIVFEPTALPVLKAAFPDIPVRYFFSVL